MTPIDQRQIEYIYYLLSEHGVKNPEHVRETLKRNAPRPLYDMTRDQASKFIKMIEGGGYDYVEWDYSPGDKR